MLFQDPVRGGENNAGVSDAGSGGGGGQSTGAGLLGPSSVEEGGREWRWRAVATGAWVA